MSRPLSDRHAAWLEARGLDPVEMQERFGLYSARSVRGAEGFQEPEPDPKGDILVWPYVDGGVEVNAKFRAPGKRFYQRPGALKTFCNADVMDDPALHETGGPALVITEGEPDMAAAVLDGHPWSMSVPDGAPADVDQHGRPIPMKPDRELDPANDPKFEYLVNNWSRLESVKRFVLATDDDGPGRRLRDELARRLGRVRCMTLDYPKEARVPIEEGFGKRPPKDLNEVRQYFGAGAALQCIRAARPYPVMGLYQLSDYQARDELVTYPIGLQDLDDYVRLYAGAFVVVSGIPEHGKSLLVDQIAFNMAWNYGWTVGVATFEEDVTPNLRNKLTSFYLMKLRQNWTARDRAEADAFIEERFKFISEDPHGQDSDEPATVEWLLARAAEAVIRFGILLLIIDPWNELEHMRKPGEMRDEYVARVLRLIKRFAKQYGIAVFVVVHPTKAAGDRALRDDEPMSAYDISDGAMWLNKAEILMIVTRSGTPNEVGRAMSQVDVKKNKFHAEGSGKRGSVQLIFDARLNMFNDQPVSQEQITFDNLKPEVSK